MERKLTSKEMTKVILDAKDKHSILRSDDYINTQLDKKEIRKIIFQMGPNCNLECSHCYGCYGPKRKGLPKKEIIKKTLDDAIGPLFDGCLLTDGEPLRYENREVIKELARNSSNFPLSIMTNTTFARTKENTFSWLNLLKDNGFNLNNPGNEIHLSCGSMYNVNINNYFRFNETIKRLYPDADFGKNLTYQFIYFGDSPSQDDLFFEIIKGIGKSFGGKGELSSGYNETGILNIKIPTKKSDFKIHCRPCSPDGRAYNSHLFDDLYPIKDLSVQDLGFSPDLVSDVWVSHKGDVGFGLSGACVRKGRFYGNVMEENFLNIVDKIDSDSVYNAYKLGGVRFMYSLAQEINPDFKIKGRNRCNVCHSFFNDQKLVEKTREKLDRQGIVKSYKKYMKGIDLRKKSFL